MRLGALRGHDCPSTPRSPALRACRPPRALAVAGDRLSNRFLPELAGQRRHSGRAHGLHHSLRGFPHLLPSRPCSGDWGRGEGLRAAARRRPRQRRRAGPEEAEGQAGIVPGQGEAGGRADRRAGGGGPGQGEGQGCVRGCATAVQARSPSELPSAGQCRGCAWEGRVSTPALS
jgi:hypothetical protein